jgi:carboxypeptidase family protein
MRVSIAASIALLLAVVPAAAQAPPPERAGTVRVVVHDATELPVRDAEVMLTGNGATAATRTDDRGEARFDRVSPGEYSGRVTSPGFSPFEIAQFDLRPRGHVTREITLQIASLFEDVNVRPDTAEGRLRDAFVRQLTDDELAALPEDPEELARVLALLAGDDADIRVDGFKGGRLPLGTQIQEVRIRHDAGAASRSGGARVEIRTTPGGERWRNTASMTLRDEALNARDPFALQRPTGQTRQYSWSLNGPLVRNQTGLSLTVDGSQSVDNQAIRAATPSGLYTNLIDQPSTSLGLWARVDHQISPEQGLRVEFKRSNGQARNQGIGQFDLPERAYKNTTDAGEFHVAHHATLRRGFASDLRFALEWDATDARPLTTARTIQVLDAFTGGGAGQQGGQRSKRIEIEHETEFELGQRHGISAGASVDGSHYRGDEHSNAAGTYIFSSLAAFEAGQPATFTQRIGDPTFRYSLYRFGWYVQDDYLVRRNVMINLGVRHDFQTHMRDWVNFSPRLGISWTPSSTARTTFRASTGISHSGLDASTYQQLLLIDGVAQRDVVISNPGYPDPFSEGITEAATPASIIRARPDLVMPSSRQYSLGVDQPIGRLVRLRGTFLRQTGQHLFRSRNANDAIDGVRPDPAVLNITELETSARSLTQSFRSEVMVNYPPRRFSAHVNYVIGEMMNETDGPFALPPDSVDLTREWGPSSADARHGLNVALNSDVMGGFRVAAFFRAQSALPYNVTLGTDPNGDGVFNERPAGMTRNSARGSAQRNLDLMLTWRVGLGQGRAPGAVTGRSNRKPGSADDPFRVEVFAHATNVLNLVNTLNVSGVLTSPFFGLPTSASTPRRVTLGTRVWF